MKTPTKVTLYGYKREDQIAAFFASMGCPPVEELPPAPEGAVEMTLGTYGKTIEIVEGPGGKA
jgi:hypothetical protein